MQQSEQTEGLKKRESLRMVSSTPQSIRLTAIASSPFGEPLYSTIKLLHPLPYICVTCVTIVETG